MSQKTKKSCISVILIGFILLMFLMTWESGSQPYEPYTGRFEWRGDTYVTGWSGAETFLASGAIQSASWVCLVTPAAAVYVIVAPTYLPVTIQDYIMASLPNGVISLVSFQAILDRSNQTATVTNLNDVGDVNAAAPSNGFLLSYDSGGNWRAQGSTFASIYSQQIGAVTSNIDATTASINVVDVIPKLITGNKNIGDASWQIVTRDASALEVYSQIVASPAMAYQQSASGYWKAAGGLDTESNTFDIATNGKGRAIAGTGNNGRILWSNDYGRTWSRAIVNTASTANQVYAVDYIEGATWIAACRSTDAVILMSTDDGYIWNDVKQNAFPAALAQEFYSIKYLGRGILLAAGDDGGTDCHVARSTDYGYTWTDLGVLDAAHKEIFRFGTNGRGTVILAADNPDIYRSTDWGATWTQVQTLGGTGDLSNVIYLGDGVWLALYAGNNSAAGVWRSEDDGVTWTQMSTWISPTFGAWSIEYCGNGIVWAGSSGTSLACWVSRDYGITWEGVVAPVEAGGTRVQNLCYLGQGVLLASVNSNGGVHRMTPWGEPYMPVYTSADGAAVIPAATLIVGMTIGWATSANVGIYVKPGAGPVFADGFVSFSDAAFKYNIRLATGGTLNKVSNEFSNIDIYLYKRLRSSKPKPRAYIGIPDATVYIAGTPTVLNATQQFLRDRRRWKKAHKDVPWEIGPLVEHLPNWLRNGQGYSMTQLMWSMAAELKALRQKIEALEAGP